MVEVVPHGCILGDGQECADCGSMVSLNGQDACRHTSEQLGGKHGGCAVVSSHTDVLEDEGTQKEGLIEGVCVPCGGQCGVEGSVGSSCK